MIETELGIKIECKRRNGRIKFRVWRDNPISGFSHTYELTQENALNIISEITESLGWRIT